MGMKIVATGSYLPPRRVGNQELIAKYLRPRKPNGKPVEAEWLEKKFAIRERHLDIEIEPPSGLRRWLGYGPTVSKRSPEEGGMYEAEMVIEALMSALADSHINPADIDGFILVSCTPDTASQCSGHLKRLSAKLQELGVPENVMIKHCNLGCAGLADGFELASWAIASGRQNVVVAAANCPSGHMRLRDRYVHSRNGPNFDWLSLAVFADGAAVAILQPSEMPGEGFTTIAQRVNPDLTLVSYPAGGMENPTEPGNANLHLYSMDPEGVAKVFGIEVPKSINLLERHIGTSIRDLDRVLIHQANGRLIEDAIRNFRLDPAKVPIRTFTQGNMAAASTLVILDEDRRAGLIGPKSRIGFLWIGAGAGAHSGYAVLNGVPTFPNASGPISPPTGVKLQAKALTV